MLLCLYMAEGSETPTTQMTGSEVLVRRKELFTKEKLHEVALILYPPKNSTERLFGQPESAEPFDVNREDREKFLKNIFQFTEYVLGNGSQLGAMPYASVDQEVQQKIQGTALFLERYMTMPKTDDQASLTSDESLPVFQPTDTVPQTWLENTGFNPQDLGNHLDIRSALQHCINTSLAMITRKPVQSERTFG